MDLVTPDFGLFFWTILIFLILVFLLWKFVWPPILKAVKEREDNIENALQAAAQAREQMGKLKADNEKIIQEAKHERDKLIREAREVKEKIISEAKTRANEEAGKIMESTRQSIENEKDAAITEIKNKVASLSLEIAEKILKDELSNKEKQKQLIESLLKEIELN